MNNQGPLTAFILLLVPIALFCGIFIGDISTQQRYERRERALLIELGTVQEDLEVVRVQNQSVEKVLEQALQNNSALADQLVTMNESLSKLRYVVNSTGRIDAGETTTIVVSRDIPAPDHDFKLSNGLVVASLRSHLEGEQIVYEYPTYDLSFDTNLIITERLASLDVLVTSSFEPENQIRVTQETKALATRQHKLFEPHLLMGASLSGPSLALEASAASSFIHPTPDLDLLGVRIGGNNNQLSIGLDPVLYNVGSRLPILTNTWAGAGVSLNTQAEINLTVTLGGKL